MTQAPATPKLRRAVLQAVALASLRAARALPMQPSERAALELRAALGGAPMPAPKRVVFLIPLVGPAQVGDWAAVETRLQGTLASLAAQTDPRWQAVICCQRRPATLPEDPRIAWLRFDDPRPGNDKWRKLAALCDHLSGLGPEPALVMSFDADDLLHRDAVGWMLSRAPGGALVRRGLVMDHATGRVAVADRPGPARPLRKPFWKLCGSCCALPWSAAMPEATAFLRAMTAHEHRMFPHLARLAGLRPVPIPFDAALYVLNHGENFGIRRGRTGFKTRFVERFALPPDEAAVRLAAGFPPVL